MLNPHRRKRLPGLRLCDLRLCHRWLCHRWLGDRRWCGLLGRELLRHLILRLKDRTAISTLVHAGRLPERYPLRLIRPRAAWLARHLTGSITHIGSAVAILNGRLRLRRGPTGRHRRLHTRAVRITATRIWLGTV